MTVSRAADDFNQIEGMTGKVEANPMCEDGGRAEERPGGTKRFGRHDATIPTFVDLEAVEVPSMLPSTCNINLLGALW